MLSKIKLIGAAIDACASTRGSADTPDILNAKWLPALRLKFDQILRYTDGRNDVIKLERYLTNLAISCKHAVINSEFPIVVGGDHSSAIGTWSGIVDAYALQQQSIGLIWLDAHMDAHSPETTVSGNIHGMPVAALLGEGHASLTSILGAYPKIKPENIILIGIRSFEIEEEQRLQRLGVKIYYIDEVASRGFGAVFQEAWGKLIASVDKIGLSIDLDGFDPEFVPGVGTLEPNGINLPNCITELDKLVIAQLAGLEITEGNHHFDISGKTMQCIVDIIQSIIKVK